MTGPPTVETAATAAGPSSASGERRPPSAAAATPASRHPLAAWRTLAKAGKGLAGFVVVAGIWELALTTGLTKHSTAPTIPRFISAIGSSLNQGIVSASGFTLQSWVITLALSVAIGGALGVLTGISRLLDATTAVFFDFIRPLPPVALLPAVIVIVGIGRSLEIVVGVSAALWPVLLGAHYGVSHTDPRMLDTGRAMGLSRLRIVTRIVLPSALPSIVTGIRLAAMIALAVVIGVELVGDTGGGIGTYITTATSVGENNQAFAGGFAAAVLGLAITGVFALAERRMLRWTPNRR